jgi:hypothetical protein
MQLESGPANTETGKGLSELSGSEQLIIFAIQTEPVY